MDEAAWEAQLARLAAYKEAHGDCNVPCSWAEDPRLGTWVANQRNYKKRLDRGHPSSGMTAARGLGNLPGALREGPRGDDWAVPHSRRSPGSPAFSKWQTNPINIKSQTLFVINPLFKEMLIVNSRALEPFWLKVRYLKSVR